MTDKITITIEKVDGLWAVSGNTSDGKTPLVATGGELWDAQQYVDTYLRLFNRQEEEEKAAARRLARDPSPSQYNPYYDTPCLGHPMVAPPPAICEAECPPVCGVPTES